ncbi:M24 family metallopeptidase [Polymorphobacter sp.]|uniref:M24 family metallopeptidase n=1 Tax=Polymorphobacter sp. TaxID=1909290 RepID=UPI003F70B467
MSAAPAIAAPSSPAPTTAPTLMDRERAAWLIGRAGLAALVLGAPESVYHASGAWQGLSRMGVRDSELVVISADPRVPVRRLSPAFAHYYMVADTGLSAGVEPLLVTGSEAGGNVAAPALFGLRAAEPMPPREARRRGAVADKPRFADMASGLAYALGSPGGRIGYDTAGAAALLAVAAPVATLIPAADLARHLRLVKTAHEIVLLRAACDANVAAALSVAADIARLGTLQAVRGAFFAQSSARGNTPVFMAVDGVVEPMHEAPLERGRALLIDCVSHRAGYHGDFGRTVFLGEPPTAALSAAQAIAAAWAALAAELRPGLRFSEVRARGAAILSGLDGGAGLNVPFQPHCVGLAHTEQPFADLDGKPLDIILEPGMVISVDCPLMEAGNWGTLHLEDLTLITADGATPLHDTGQPILMA